MIFKTIKLAETHKKQTNENICLSKDCVVPCHSETYNRFDWKYLVEFQKEKKEMLLQKIFEPIAQWVQGWWKGEEVRTWGDTFVWHLNWDKCPRLFSCWTSEKKSEDGKMGLWITLNCKNLAWPYRVKIAALFQSRYENQNLWSQLT